MRVTAAVGLGYQQGISSHSQPDTPRRKLLFVPGDSATKLFLSCLLSPAFSSVRFHITCSRMRRLARKPASSKPQTKTNTNDRENGIYTASQQKKQPPVELAPGRCSFTYHSHLGAQVIKPLYYQFCRCPSFVAACIFSRFHFSRKGDTIWTISHHLFFRFVVAFLRI